MSNNLEAEMPAPTDAEPARPVVVIQYRKKGGVFSRLAIPVVILIVAAAILSHRMRIGDWRGLSALLGRPEVTRKPTAADSGITTDPDPASQPRPIVIRQAPTPPPVIATKPEPPAETAPLAPPPPPKTTTLAFLRPSPVVIDLPESNVQPAPSGNTEQAFEEIRIAAAKEAEKKANVAEQEDLKAKLLARDLQNADVRRGEHETLARIQVEEARKTFRADLERILVRPGKSPAREIIDLCKQSGVKLGDNLRRVNKDLGDGFTAAGRVERIANCRAQGMSEALILDDLVRVIAANAAVSRSGPKSKGDLIELASQELLKAAIKRPTAGPTPARGMKSQLSNRRHGDNGQ